MITANTAVYGTLEDRHAAAQRLVARHGGTAVLWIEEGSTNFFFYLVRPFEAAVYQRSVPVVPRDRKRSLASLHRVSEELAAAVDQEQPLPMTRVPLTPSAVVAQETEPVSCPRPQVASTKPPAPPDKGTPERGEARLALAYSGTTYARDKAWLDGVSFSAGWTWPKGPHVELGYTAYRRALFQTHDGLLELARHPVHAAFGYDQRWRRVRVGAEGLLLVDPTVRRDYVPTQLSPVWRPQTVTSLAFAPRGRIGFIAGANVELFASVAAEFWVQRTTYRASAEPEASEIIVAPGWARATPSAGLALRL